MGPLDVTCLTGLMGRTSDQPEISIGVIDSPPALNLLDPTVPDIRKVSPKAQRRFAGMP